MKAQFKTAVRVRKAKVKQIVDTKWMSTLETVSRMSRTIRQYSKLKKIQNKADLIPYEQRIELIHTVYLAESIEAMRLQLHRRRDKPVVNKRRELDINCLAQNIKHSQNYAIWRKVKDNMGYYKEKSVDGSRMEAMIALAKKKYKMTQKAEKRKKKRRNRGRKSKLDSRSSRSGSGSPAKADISFLAKFDKCLEEVVNESKKKSSQENERRNKIIKRFEMELPELLLIGVVANAYLGVVGKRRRNFLAAPALYRRSMRPRNGRRDGRLGVAGLPGSSLFMTSKAETTTEEEKKSTFG